MRVNFGDIVWSYFYNFDGEKTKAMFVICYHECDDIKGSTNITGFKISSHPRGFQIPLFKRDFPFLKHEISYLNCNRPFPLREDEITSVVGRFNPYYTNKMLQQMNMCMDRSRNQAIKIIGEDKLFEINKPHTLNY